MAVATADWPINLYSLQPNEKPNLFRVVSVISGWIRNIPELIARFFSIVIIIAEHRKKTKARCF